MDPLFTLELYSHGFKIINHEPRLCAVFNRLVMKNCISEWSKDQRGRPLLVPKYHFGFSNGLTEYRFHIGQLPFLMQLLHFNAIRPEQYKVVKKDIPEGDKVDIRFDWDKYKLRKFQPDALEFILSSSEDDLRTRMVSVYTGGGKSVIASAATDKIGKRVLMPILPKYVGKWIKDVQEYTDTTAKEIAVINGLDTVAGLIQMGKDGQLEKIKFIILSLTTLRMFYKEYQQSPEGFRERFGIEPEDLCRVLGIGLILMDEGHEHIYSIYQVLTYSNVDKVITLSATMTSADRNILEVQDFMFPLNKRFLGDGMEKYITCRPVSYTFHNFHNANIRWKAWGSNLYSHTAFEKCIMQNKGILRDYLDMILFYVKKYYHENYQSGDRGMVFAATSDMCTHIVNHLKKHLPGYDIRRFTPSIGDPYENMTDPDIRVTTSISGGTGHDIKKLTTVIQTITVLAPVQNHQAYGRLRAMEGRELNFLYLFCEQIPKQVESHQIKKKLFRPKAAAIIDAGYAISIGSTAPPKQTNFGKKAAEGRIFKAW